MKETHQIKFDPDFSLVGYLWKTDKKEPLGTVLIVHGIAEHIERYDDFANFLTVAGFNVVGASHYMHGLSCPDIKNLGIIEKYDYIEAVIKGIKAVKEHFASYFIGNSYLFSHSMGSIACQTYIQTYPNDFSKIILCGTDVGGLKYKIAKPLTFISFKINGKKKQTKLVYNLSFGAYVKKFKERYPLNWLSLSKDNIKNYQDDPYCGVPVSDYATFCISNALINSAKTKNIKKINKDVKILIISGSDDPVSNFGKSVNKLFKKYKKRNLNVSKKLYKNLRHEILNEDSKKDIYQDIVNFYK